MTRECFVGFDTSNYTASAAVCTKEGEVIANIKAPLPVKGGECGLRQSDAVFAHVKNLPEVVKALREAINGYRVLAVGCSTRPRDLEDSYMPCFLSGRVAAESFAAALNIPVIETAHQDGHIMAAAYSSGAMEQLLRLGIMDGYSNGTARPNASITRAEAVTFINNYLFRGELIVSNYGYGQTYNYQTGYNYGGNGQVLSFTDLSTSHWAYGHIMEATNNHRYERVMDGNEEML